MARLTLLRLLVAVALVTAAIGAVTMASQRTAASMAAAANQFLASLTSDQRAKATFGFADEERLRWHFIPNEMFPRKGLMIKDMTPAQRPLAQALLKSGLSQRGYMTVAAIMDLESVLKAVENSDRFARNREEYLFSVFGTPSATGAWGWRVEGHHVSLRFTIVKGSAVASSPAFLGTNPAEVRAGEKKGLRILAAREDTARAFLDSLDAARRTAAIINPTTAPGDILTMNTNDITALDSSGVKASALTATQRDLLMQLVDAYLGTMEADIASERLAALKAAGLDAITFAWAGETARGRKHYYRVQGPTFLVEYDNTQNDGNHIHSVWRDFNGDFGRDLLRDHLVAVAH